MYYTQLTEHYLRLAVRSPAIKDDVSAHWQAVARQWIDNQSAEDQAFIKEVFKYECWTTKDGLDSLPGSFRGKRSRLDKLLKEFAIHSQLYAQEDIRK